MVLAQMEYLPPISLPMVPPKTPVSNGEKFDVAGYYIPNEKFLTVLRKTPGINPTQVIFSYQDICSHFFEYILLMRDIFFDNR